MKVIYNYFKNMFWNINIDCFFVCVWLFSKLDWSIKNTSWTRYRWKGDCSIEAKVFLLWPEHRLPRSGAAESAVRAGARRHHRWHASRHPRQGLRLCGHPVSHSIWRPFGEQTQARISWVSLIWCIGFLMLFISINQSVWCHVTFILSF